MDVIDTKSIYQDVLQMQLDEWRLEIRRMRARAKYAEEGVKYFYFEQLDALVKKRERVESKLSKLRNVRKRSNWKKLRFDFEKSWDDLAKSMKVVELKMH
ncbi:MAG: hypothetical protein MK132_03600 [Lentisphaerales bacterium]|nr:hypothetical protein [Lentisphaerales bacterium]